MHEHWKQAMVGGSCRLSSSCLTSSDRKYTPELASNPDSSAGPLAIFLSPLLLLLGLPEADLQPSLADAATSDGMTGC
jgi:hypothetical protein